MADISIDIKQKYTKKNKNNPTNIPEIVEKFAARERSDPSAGEVRANSKRNPPDGSFELFTHMYM